MADHHLTTTVQLHQKMPGKEVLHMWQPLFYS